jgi:DNA-binding transcriptional LysR family regulator
LLLRQLRYFATVAEQGSVVGAAKELRLAQPALSRHMHRLEQVVGTPLLERERRGVRLTAAGEVLLSRIRPLVARLEEAFQRAHLANEGRLGTLRLGLGRVALDSTRVGRAIASLRDHFPEVQLVVSEVPSRSQSEKLRAGELDLAIGLDGVPDDAVANHALYEFHVDCAVLPATDALASASALDAAQLRGKPLLVVDPAIVGTFPHLYEGLRRLGIMEWQTHDSVESVYSLVAAGRGWTLAPSAVRAQPPAGTVVIPLNGLSVPLTMSMRWRSGDNSALISNVTPVLRRASAENGQSDTPLPVLLPSEKMRPDPRSVPTGLELRHLRALIVIAELGSLSRAAERLGLTQSGVSRQIRALEREVGFPVLRRESRGVAPTAAGEVLLREAEAALARVDEAVTHTRQAVRGVAGRCRIGCVAAEFAGDILVDALKHLADAHPDIGVAVTEMLTPLQILALREGRIDVGIGGANPGVMDDPVIAGVRLVDDVIECALLAESHPLATRPSLEPADLADQPFLFIARSTHPQFYDVVLHALGSIGLVPLMNGSLNGPRALWRSAADSMGWTLGSRSLRTKPLPGLVAVPIEGLQIPSGLQLLWRRNEADPTILAVLEAFRQTRSTETVTA